MQLKVVNSNSSGNSFALDSGKEILLLEAGCKMAEVKRAINYRISDVVGCLVSHAHGDHSKYATEFAKFGVKVYCNQDVADKKQFPYDTCKVIKPGKTFSVGSFRIAPIALHHDVPNTGFVIYHEDCGTIFFALDTYKFDFNISGIDHWLIEANYDDRILKANVQDGKIDRAQANRLMLSHMSLDNTIHFLRDCGAEKSKNNILCHLSERNSDPLMFMQRVKGEFGVPVVYAAKGLVVELNKEVL